MNEKKLWASVLGRAVIDLRRKKHRQSARFWFYNDKNQGAGSFLWVCDVLEIDPGKTREKVFKKIKNAA